MAFDALGSRRLPLPQWLVWVTFGASIAIVPATAGAVGIDTRYVLYGVITLGVSCVSPYVVMVAGSAESLLWMCFVLSLQLEVAYTPIAYGGTKVAGPFGTMITPALLGAAALLALATAQRMWGTAQRLRVERLMVIAAGGMLLTAVLSMLNAAGRTLSLFGVFELVSLSIVAVAASNACSEAKNLRLLRQGFFVILFVQSCLIIIEQSVGVQISLSRGINADYGWGNSVEGRFAGTFGAPSSAATFLVVSLLFLLRHMIATGFRQRSGKLWALFALGLLALLLTRTRSGWIGFIIGCAGMTWQARRAGTLPRWVTRRLLIAGVLALLLAWPLVSGRLADDHRGMADTRGNLAWIAAEMIKAHPVLGVGINTATNQVYQYAVRAGLSSGWVFIVHNQFLLVAAETGIPGLAAFSALIWVGLRAARRSMRSDDPLLNEIAGATFWALVAMVWALNLDHVSGCMTYVLLWALIGAASGLWICDTHRAGELAASTSAAVFKG